MNTTKAHLSPRRYLLALCMFTMLVGVAPASATFASAAPATPPAATHTLGDPQELETFVDGVMTKQLADQHVAGAVVVIVQDGQVLLSKGYGYADVEKRIPVDPERTLFRPGSATKLFTWTAVMQLVEQGKIDLQADVNTYLTRFKIPATYPQPITMLDLMAHTAGFEDRDKNLFKSSCGRNDLARRLPGAEYACPCVPARPDSRLFQLRRRAGGLHRRAGFRRAVRAVHRSTHLQTVGHESQHDGTTAARGVGARHVAGILVQQRLPGRGVRYSCRPARPAR